MSDPGERLLGQLGPERSRQLGGVWPLPSPAPGDRGVPDVEHLCRAVLVAGLRRSRMHIQDVDFNDALAFLLGEVVVLHARYVPAPNREIGPYLFQRLRWRLIDHWRERFGRAGQHRPCAHELKLEWNDEAADAEALRRGAYEPGPGEALETWASDSLVDRVADLLGLPAG